MYRESKKDTLFLDKAVVFNGMPSIKSRRQAIDAYVAKEAYIYECTKEFDKRRSFRASLGSNSIKITKAEYEYAKSIIDYKVNLINPNIIAS